VAVANVPSNGGFKVTRDDVEILTHVYRHRTLHVEHLAHLTGRHPKRVHRRLLPLAEKRYLWRAEPAFHKHLYFVGSAGVPLLVQEGVAPKEAIDGRLRDRELKPLFLAHLMMIVDLHVMLELASRGGPIRLTQWAQGRELWDTTREKLPVQPDAFFTLEDGRRPAGQRAGHFFLEADRSTMAHQRMEKKFTAYVRYLNEEGHTRRYGIKTFRVVTVTLTPGRARGLGELARSILPEVAHKYFLFASLDSLSLTHPYPLLTDIFAVPGRDDLARLMPEPQASSDPILVK
jgi:hypothetical protein